MGRFKCIVFDFDGTLADSHRGIVTAYQETFRRLGLDVPSEEFITSTIGLTLEDGFKAMDKKLTDEDAIAAAVLYRGIFPEIAYPLITAFPGVVDVLSMLHNQGYLMAIATSRSHASLEDLATQIGVAPFFHALFGAEDVVNHKPAPDMVNLVLRRFSLKPEEVLVVGDANYDLLMGKGAGCCVCGISWGNQSRDLLAAVKPDYLIDSIDELPCCLY